MVLETLAIFTQKLKADSCFMGNQHFM